MINQIRSNLFKSFFNLVGVKGKIMGIAIILILLLASLLILESGDIFTQVLRNDLEKQGVSLARYMAVRSEDFLLTNNLFGLHQLIKDVMQNNQELAYILVINSQGELVADSFGSKIPKGLISFNQINSNQGYSSKTFKNEDGIIHDIAVPIWQGRYGIVRLGVSEIYINQALIKLKYLLWFSTILVSLLGVAIAYFLANLINEPLSELVIATEKVGSGKLDYRVSLDWAEDELGKLGQAFNQMTVKLQRAAIERQKLWKQLQKKEERRQYLLNKVIMAQEEERKRIARELHDETSQALTSLNLALANLENTDEQEEFNERIKMMKKTIAKVLDEINLLARQLRPSILDNLGLAAAIENYIKESSEYWGKDIGLHINGLINTKFPKEVEITVYRIVQEALTNALRYADADNISVIMNNNDGNLLIIVEDDGCGFNLEDFRTSNQTQEHLGLFGMQERADLLGGELTIETGEGIGTTIYVNIPVDNKSVIEEEFDD
ncbi:MULTISPECIES: sensor histidine kinase [unclassified Candidatus Frackibacter]|uniref:sensor histidine kinase n=1 Tax=unclassified Candidatus Frackibacter TaxID=2648818 RepID=UPI00088D2ACD|nr:MULTISPECIES: sensor histidine kinase [unclassified Candidatus Frackibacter]SDC00173.1 Signal transduction histidine kinase [Candidatus Frackibacter sp. WG11]SEM31710.1 Signal transduction histidine kinase [Candidatus Frackibacter sp. WG12]SFL36625.1 Signal transduction histidine kinase [Candidatus Frackibacter sp. WG13]